MIDISHVGQ